ncbi:MAG: 2-hydroxy-3-oxopropionate reductase [bacterium]|nr:MAG: 2-hydroxy-3-oxopropionate reductase [bacterium]
MTSLGFIGLGTMGQPMALNLRRAGHPLTVFARNIQRAEPLVRAGAHAAMTPRGVAEAADIVFVNVADDAALDVVLFGAEGAAEGLAEDAVVVDMGTTSPAATRDFSARLAQRGAHLLDAPVSGGEAGAKSGTLSIMVGGPEAPYQRVLPLFQVLGDSIVHVGGTGAGQVAKACNQIAVSATLLGVAEALDFAARQGVDPGHVRQALLGGSAYSRILEIHGQRMLDRNFVPGFKARLHQKDLAIVLDEARRLGLALPGAALSAQLMNALVGAGGGEGDSSALIEVLESMNGSRP